jgi:diguanylate cyclase (GGDEF)-like protein
MDTKRADELGAWRSAGAVSLVASVSVALDAVLHEQSAWVLAAHALLAAALMATLTLRERDRRRLAWDATHDPLTGLLNRRGLVERMRAVAPTLRGVPLSVVYVDLDDFKRHNDVHGHAAGDAILVAIARALGGRRATDLAARLGGDELVLVLPRAGAAEARAVLARVRDRFARDVEALGIDATFSAGVRTFEGTAAGDVDVLLAASDGAMYADKRNKHARRTRAAQPETSGRPRRWVQLCEATSR